MKICIIFRGETVRDYIKHINTFDNVKNIQEHIFNDLREHGIDYDIALITYENEIVKDFQKEYNVKDTIICEYISQQHNMAEVNKYTQDHALQYDRFIILRFDILYKIKITNWNKFYEEGILVPNRDVTYDVSLFCNDVIFIIDQSYVNIFNDAVEYMMSIEVNPSTKFLNWNSVPHYIGRYLTLHHLPITYMYDELYDGVINHPLYWFQRSPPGTNSSSHRITD